MRKSVMVALSILGLVALAACSGPEADQPLVIDGDPSVSPSAPSSEASPSPEDGSSPGPSDGDRDSKADVITGDLPPSGDRRAAAIALVDYMRVRSAAFNRVGVDLTELSSVAMGPALQDVQSGVAYRRQKNLHMVGDVRVDVRSVKATGRQARISSCLENSTAEANPKGRVVELDPTPYYLTKATAVRVDKGLWLISEASFSEVGSC